MYTAEDLIWPEQYGTGIHWPYCHQARCTGCFPHLSTSLPEPQCAPAIGVHVLGCVCIR